MSYSQKNCVLYTRVSSKEQEKEGFSIPAQQKLLRSYAIDNQLKNLLYSFMSGMAPLSKYIPNSEARGSG